MGSPDSGTMSRCMADSRRQRPWWRRGWVAGPLAACVVLLLLGAGRFVLDRRVRSALAEIRQEGFPVTPQELHAWYPVPESVNAADMYARAFEAYDRDVLLEQALPIFNPAIGLPAPGEPLGPGVKDACRRYIERNREPLDLLRTAASIPACRFPIDLTKPHDMDAPHLAGIRHAARLLYLEVLVATDEGDWNTGLGSVATMLRVSKSLGREPTSFAHAISIATQFTATTALERVLFHAEAHALQTERLEQVDRLLEKTVETEGLVRALAGDRTTCLRSFRQPPSFSTDPFWVELGLGLWKAVGLRTADELAYLRMTDEKIRIARKSPTRPHQWADALGPPPWYAVFSRMYYQQSVFLMRMSARSRGFARVARVALAAKRFQAATGRLPERIEDLVPAHLGTTPLDIIGEGPLRYRRTERGAVIYGVGLDGRDDGGTEEDVRGRRFTAGTDITFSLALVE